MFTSIKRLLLEAGSEGGNGAAAGAAGGAAAGGGTPAPTADTIPLSRAEYDSLVKVRDQATSLAAKTKELEEKWEKTQKVFKNPNAPDAEQSLRGLMADMGFSAADIEKQFSSGDDTDGRGAPAPKGKGKAPAEDEDQGPEPIEQLAERLERMEQDATRQNQEHLQELLTTSVEMHAGNTDFSGVAERLAKNALGPEADSKELQAHAAETAGIMKKDLEREIKNALRDRRNRTGTFDKTWIKEEAAKAAKTVSSKYGRYVGDPGRISKASESSDIDAFLKSPPVAVPKFSRGMDVSTAKTQAEKYIADRLARLGSEVASGN